MGKELLKFLRLKDNEITTERIQIEENLLRFDNFTLQLSNISQIYAGEKKFQLPRWVIILFIISIMILANFPYWGLLGLLVSGGYSFLIYQDFMNERLFLSFSLNSGKMYELRFREHQFLAAVRKEVEQAFHSQKVHAVINIAEQKIVNGDHHEVYGDYANVNSGIQTDNILHSHNEDSFNQTDASFTMGDIQNSSLHSTAFGRENFVKGQPTPVFYDWTKIQQGLQQVKAMVTDESTLEAAVTKALSAAKHQDQLAFEQTVREHRSDFMSGFFKDTASGLLVQIVARVLGIV
ncbi:hypothetical protein ACSFB8_11880 [Enterococcus faecalis]